MLGLGSHYMAINFIFLNSESVLLAFVVIILHLRLNGDGP